MSTSTLSNPLAQDAAQRATTPPPRRRRRHPDGAWPWLFVGVPLLGITVFYLWPIISTFVYSFTSWGVFGGATFAGIVNYQQLLADPRVLGGIFHTVVYVAIVLLSVPIATAVAALMERPGMRFVGLYRTLFFIPYITMPAAVSITWKYIFNGDYGPLNWLLTRMGLPAPYWLATPGWALVAVSVVGLWMAIGFNLIVLSAGIREIPRELYEAAELDGAGRARQFFSVTVPLLTPSLFFVVTMSVINGFQLFDLLYVMIGQGNVVMPNSQSLVYLFYDMAYVQNDKGYAAAIAILIMVVVAVVTAVQFRLQKRWVHYA
jgi:multiple sugar transport system permease protein